MSEEINNNSVHSTQTKLTQNVKKTRKQQNLGGLEQKKNQKEQSIEEKVMLKNLSGVENLQLSRVFQILCGKKSSDSLNLSKVPEEQLQQY